MNSNKTNGAKQPLSLLTNPALRFSDKGIYKDSFKPTTYPNFLGMLSLPVVALLFCDCIIIDIN